MNEPIWWQQLVETALLGTERSGLTASDLPSDLALTGAVVSPERATLQTAALAVNYLRAGAEPLIITLPNLPVCNPETQPYAPEAAMRLLDKILDEPTPNRRLLGLWLAKCVERGRVVPPVNVVPLLTVTANALYADCYDNLLRVVGECGRWLSQFNDEWNHIMPPDPETVWQEGDSTGRFVALRQMRRADPAKAVELLLASWPTEAAKDRVKWMAVLSENATLADEPFATGVLDELNAGRKATVAHRDLRVQTVALLLNVPGSALFRKTQSTLAEYVTVRRKLLLSNVKMLHLPERQDAFFNEQTMTAYGFGTDAALTGANQVQQWFYQLLAVLHPSCWTTIFAVDDSQLVSLLKRQDWFTGGGIASFTQSVLRHRIGSMASELLSLVADNQRPFVLSLLPQRTREDRLIGSGDLTKNLAPYAWLTAPDASAWSQPFSDWVVQEILSILRQQYQLHPMQRQVVADLVLVIHPATRLTQLPDESATGAPNYQAYVQNMAQNQLIAPLTRWLDLRREITNL